MVKPQTTKSHVVNDDVLDLATIGNVAQYQAEASKKRAESLKTNLAYLLTSAQIAKNRAIGTFEEMADMQARSQRTIAKMFEGKTDAEICEIIAEKYPQIIEQRREYAIAQRGRGNGA